jgi:serine/threonine protein kinase
MSSVPCGTCEFLAIAACSNRTHPGSIGLLRRAAPDTAHHPLFLEMLGKQSLRYTDFVIASGESGPRPPKLGRYELITRIGQGGMAEVQLALQRGPAGFEKLVVVKLIHENLASQKPFVDMLLDEARVAALVKHPNVVDIYDLGVADGRYFIAMEYLEGEPLLAVLRAGREGQRLDVLSTARLIADTAEGLDAAHELRSMAGDPIGLVHHDVSLGNIVVLYNGQVKLVDFGVAKATQSAVAHTKLGGKFGYMAPEKLRGGPGDRRSDIWSLGCVLWEALTLKRLFDGGNDFDTMKEVLHSAIPAPSTVNSDVPADFDDIALQSLARDPVKRYPTAKAMAAELEEVLRRHGYAAKNDRIARYMQAAFHDHIAARKKLLQEVSSKGRASPDLVEAAFRRPRDPAEPSFHGTALVVPRTDAEPTADELAVPGPGDERTEVEEPVGSPSRRWIVYAIGAWAVLALVIATSMVVIGARSEPESWPHAEIGVAAPLAERSVASTAAAPAVPEPGERAAGTAPSDHAPPAPPPTERAAATAPSDHAPLPPPSTERAGAPAPSSVAAAPAEPAADRGREPAPPTRAPVVRPTRSTPARQASRAAQPPRPAADKADKPDKGDRVDPDEVFKTGLQAWVHGDSKAALAQYRRVLQANPKYAAAWRGVGLVYERLGDKAAARVAYSKYLQLAPDASDATEVRARLESPP